MKKIQTESGLILLEAMVALLIFSIGLLGMIAFQAASFQIMSDSRFRTEAAMLADELLARMNTSELSRVRADFGPDGPQFQTWMESRVRGMSHLPAVRVTQTFADSATSAGLLVGLRIEWKEPGARLKGEAGEVRVYETRALLF